MITYVKGEIVSLEEDRVIIDVNGIGYGICMPAQTLSMLPAPGNELRIHTYLHVKEDAMQLFGFLTKDDLKVFKLLLSVSGIGPKGGLNILSQLSADELRFAIMANDVKSIAKAPGVGKKTAERLIIELRDKLSVEEILDRQVGMDENAYGGAIDSVQAEAIQALVALGYGSSEATKAVKKVEVYEYITVEEVLKQALKYMMF